MTAPTATTVRVLIALDVPADQAADLPDLIASVRARVEDEAGYLDTGAPVLPTKVVVTVVDDDAPLTPDLLRGVYEVGAEGADLDLITVSPCDVCGKDFSSDVDDVDTTVCGECDTRVE